MTVEYLDSKHNVSSIVIHSLVTDFNPEGKAIKKTYYILGGETCVQDFDSNDNMIKYTLYNLNDTLKLCESYN